MLGGGESCCSFNTIFNPTVLAGNQSSVHLRVLSEKTLEPLRDGTSKMLEANIRFVLIFRGSWNPYKVFADFPSSCFQKNIYDQQRNTLWELSSLKNQSDLPFHCLYLTLCLHRRMCLTRPESRPGGVFFGKLFTLSPKRAPLFGPQIRPPSGSLFGPEVFAGLMKTVKT